MATLRGGHISPTATVQDVKDLLATGAKLIRCQMTFGWDGVALWDKETYLG